jgi:hypothetical protein
VLTSTSAFGSPDLALRPAELQLLAFPDVDDALRQVLQFQARLIAAGDREGYQVSAALDPEPEPGSTLE